VRLDLCSDLCILFGNLIGGHEERGPAIEEFVKIYHSKIMQKGWQEHYSLYEICECKFISSSCIDFTTNINESLHGSINELFRQTFKRVISFTTYFFLNVFIKRFLKDSDSSFEILNRNMTRSYDQFKLGFDEGVGNNTKRQIKSLKLVEKIIALCKKNRRKIRTFDENVELFQDFLKKVTSQYEVIRFCRLFSYKLFYSS
jgi:hypothetical protein